MTIEQDEPRAISRRTVAKGALWSVPIVAFAGFAPAFAGFAPAFAASATVTITSVVSLCQFDGSGNSYPRDMSLRFTVTVAGEPVNITTMSVMIDPPAWIFFNPGPETYSTTVSGLPLTLGVGASTIDVRIEEDENYFTFPYGDTEGTVTFQWTEVDGTGSGTAGPFGFSLSGTTCGDGYNPGWEVVLSN